MALGSFIRKCFCDDVTDAQVQCMRQLIVFMDVVPYLGTSSGTDIIK